MQCLNQNHIEHQRAFSVWNSLQNWIKCAVLDFECDEKWEEEGEEKKTSDSRLLTWNVAIDGVLCTSRGVRVDEWFRNYATENGKSSFFSILSLHSPFLSILIFRSDVFIPLGCFFPIRYHKRLLNAKLSSKYKNNIKSCLRHKNSLLFLLMFLQ